MTASEWLRTHNKTPFHYADRYYWGTEDDKEADAPESDDMLLPPSIWNLMVGPLTYPNCRIYNTEADALADFEQAYFAAGGFE